MDPAQLKFAKTHEWVAVEGDVATVGITDFAVNLLSDLVYIDLPAAGKKVSKGQTVGEVESVKAVSDIYAPVGGEVIDSNKSLADHLDTLARDSFGAGWLVKIRMTNPADLADLMDRAAYQQHCESEAH